MKTIQSGVGRQGLNARADQETVQALLNRVPVEEGGASPRLQAPVTDRRIGAPLQAAIDRFQARQFDTRFRDGRIDPGGPTLRLLNALAGEGPGLRHHAGGARPGVIDFEQPAQRSVDVRAGLVALKQPTEDGCWATSALMMWKQRNPGRIDGNLSVRDQIEAFLGRFMRNRMWSDLFHEDQGLPQSHVVPFFCHELGMMPMDPAMHMRVALGNVGGAYFWVPLLRMTRRPWVLNTGRMRWSGRSSAHMVVLVGATLDGDLPDQFAPSRGGRPPLGVVSVLDPEIGRERRLSGHDIDHLLGPMGVSIAGEGPPPDLATRVRCLSWS
ncbi:MAG: hypothetical protein RL456_103 [Pseudomonadota bacterium]|jgi:hypothetical protein